MISYARVFFVLVLLLVLQARLAHAQFDVQAPLTLTRIVVHVEDGVIDRRFMPDLEERLRAMFVAPVDVLNNTVEGSLLHKSSSGHVDASLLLNALAASIDWQLYAGAYHVLLIAQDIRLAPDSFNFSVSMGNLGTPSRVGIVSLSRLQVLGRDTLDVAPHRTAVRVQKLIARSIVKTSGYADSGLCLHHVPRGLAVLDAMPESYCEPDLTAWTAAGLLRAR